MLLEIMVAAIIGISFGNVWTCIFMGFGTSSEHRSVGKWFIAGRFLGLIILGSIISLLRFAAQDAMPIILSIFGISTILFGLFMIFKPLLKAHLLREDSHAIPNKNPGNNFVLSLLSLFMVLPRKGKCGDKSSAPLELKTQHFHKPGNQRKCKKYKNFEKRCSFTLGLLRGTTPCVKVMVLAPLLVAVGFPSSLLLILVYASISTVYPIIGYLSADLLSKFEKYRYALKILGASILIIIGLFTLINVVM
jgi:cytochrome c biogenesis protein CcdA